MKTQIQDLTFKVDEKPFPSVMFVGATGRVCGNYIYDAVAYSKKDGKKKSITFRFTPHAGDYKIINFFNTSTNDKNLDLDGEYTRKVTALTKEYHSRFFKNWTSSTPIEDFVKNFQKTILQKGSITLPDSFHQKIGNRILWLLENTNQIKTAKNGSYYYHDAKLGKFWIDYNGDAMKKRNVNVVMKQETFPIK